jgi:hypothetical protein
MEPKIEIKPSASRYNDGKPGRVSWKSMFVQHAIPGGISPIYDLNVFHDVFLEERDVTEYKAALRLVGSWEKWCLIKRDWPAFVDTIERWKIELEQKLRSDAMQKLLALLDDSNSQTQASVAKFIVQSQWDKKEVGRPSKAEQKKAARELAKLAAATDEEAERIQQFIVAESRDDILQ